MPYAGMCGMPGRLTFKPKINPITDIEKNPKRQIYETLNNKKKRVEETKETEAFGLVRPPGT